MKKQDEGFTLIELLIVIVILGILATVVVFAVGGISDRGQDSACDADLATLEVAVEAYRAQEGVYPPSDAVLVPGFIRSSSDWFETTGGGAIAYAGNGATECANTNPTP